MVMIPDMQIKRSIDAATECRSHRGHGAIRRARDEQNSEGTDLHQPVELVHGVGERAWCRWTPHHGSARPGLPSELASDCGMHTLTLALTLGSVPPLDTKLNSRLGTSLGSDRAAFS